MRIPETYERTLPYELTADQQERAASLTLAMAEKFDVPAGNFSVLATPTKDSNVGLNVAYTALNGLELGDPTESLDHRRSWDSIFDKENNADFMIEVDGATIDTRRGLTHGLYTAIIADAQARGIDPLPDSLELSRKNGRHWTNTWITAAGEGALPKGTFAVFAPFGTVRNSFWTLEPRIRWDHLLSSYSGPGMSFRPAAAVK